MIYYLHNLCVSIDQLANTILAGYPDETLSSRAYRCSTTSYAWKCASCLINTLFLNPNHCKEAFFNEVDLPSNYQNSWDNKY